MDANLAGKRAINLRTTFIATYVAGAEDYLALMKPQVMSLAVFTALVGFLSALAMQLRGEQTGAGWAARRLFRFSILYLFLLFAILLIERELTAMPWRIAA